MRTAGGTRVSVAAALWQCIKVSFWNRGTGDGLESQPPAQVRSTIHFPTAATCKLGPPCAGREGEQSVCSARCPGLALPFPVGKAEKRGILAIPLDSFVFQLHCYLGRDVWGNRYKKGNSVGKLGFPHIERKRRFVCLLAGGRSKS